ncbi:hypothetical protein MTR67_001623 [Solanum verrucosum]|uniref:Uncharacterized protein n=1 Tax=Solanum verrucosum TaxID=315347 RepID=A0AAF0PNW4_SOLVR|nr:hypothetical protein MTR67_001623 [Solanum verrucosum]
MLKNCSRDPSLIMPTENIDSKDILSYEEIPIEIPDCQVRKLSAKEVASVKVFELRDNAWTLWSKKEQGSRKNEEKKA